MNIRDELSLKESLLMNQNYLNQLKAWMKVENIKLKLLYRGSRDGFKINKFHDLCDNKGRTLNLILS